MKITFQVWTWSPNCGMDQTATRIPTYVSICSFNEHVFFLCTIYLQIYTMIIAHIK